MNNGFQHIARQLCLDGPDPVLSVKRWLKDSSRALVVFDNVVSLEDLQPLLLGGTTDILLTTRDAALIGSEIVPYGVSVLLLEDNDAMSLFILNLSSWDTTETEEIRGNIGTIFDSKTVAKVMDEKFHLTSHIDLREVIRLTDNLPLAIVQCASYLRQYPMPFEHYLSKFKGKAREALRKSTRTQ